MTAPDELEPGSESSPHTVDIAELAPPGVVLLATICAPTAEGQTRIKPYDTEMEVMALSNQVFSPEDLHKTVACIGITASNSLVIIGVVATTQAGKSTTSRPAGILNQLLDSFQPPSDDELVFEYADSAAPEGMPNQEIQDNLLIETGRSLTIKCGASSISLSADGRVNIRGKFVTNSASQLNRLSGGSVKIN